MHPRLGSSNLRTQNIWFVWCKTDENNLQGSLPTEFAELTALKVFEMRGNGITGSVPSVLGKLLNLEEIDFRQNSLTG